MDPRNTPERPVKILCQGAGYFAQFHFDAWARLDGAEVIGVVDHDLHRAEQAGAAAFQNLAAALSVSIPDILDVITPPPTHAETIRAAIAASVPAIICQKPFCRSLTEAREVIALAQAAGVRLIVHENFRFQPWYRCIAELMNGGIIGAWLQATFQLRPGDGQGPAAYLNRQPYFQQMPRLLIHETGIHFIDTFRFLFGDPQHLYADLRRLNPAIAGEDTGYFLFGYDGGKRALFDGNRLLDHPAENHRLTMGEMLIEGTKGALKLTGNGAVSHRDVGRHNWSVKLPAQTWPGFAGDCVFAFQRHALECLSTGSKAETEAENYLVNIELEEHIYQSSAQGARVSASGAPVPGDKF